MIQTTNRNLKRSSMAVEKDTDYEEERGERRENGLKNRVRFIRQTYQIYRVGAFVFLGEDTISRTCWKLLNWCFFLS